jgi:hypothetical protein
VTQFQKHPEFYTLHKVLGRAQTDAQYSLAAGMEAGGLQKTHKDMTCERAMNLFFVRNCYSEKEREKVKASAAYWLAMEKDDAIQAQEIATRVLEAKAIT